MFQKILQVTWKGVKYYSIFHVVTEYLVPIRFFICRGSSMEPTFNNNNIILTEKLSVRLENIKK
jgi:signal peptidase I